MPVGAQWGGALFVARRPKAEGVHEGRHPGRRAVPSPPPVLTEPGWPATLCYFAKVAPHRAQVRVPVVKSESGMSEQSTSAKPTDMRVRVQGEPRDSYPERAPEAERGRVRRITVVGEDVLHRRNAEVASELFGTDELSRLIDDMFCTMYVAEGVGLAGNQVGVDLRLFVYDCPDDDGVRHVGHVINPVLDERDPETTPLVVENEGCLSVPGPHAELPRAEHATVRGFDKDGAPLVISGTGYFARCLQHETDHTYGRLYIDRLAARPRKRVLKQMNEMREEVFARRAANAAALTGEAGAE